MINYDVFFCFLQGYANTIIEKSLLPFMSHNKYTDFAIGKSASLYIIYMYRLELLLRFSDTLSAIGCHISHLMSCIDLH